VCAPRRARRTDAPRDSIVRYEAAIKADQFVVIVHRADEREAEIAERVLRESAQSVDRT